MYKTVNTFLIETSLLYLIRIMDSSIILFVTLGYRDYICVNGASILPVLALNLRPDCKLLDMCAGPGTKSILSLMSMCVGSLTCNDLESSRLNRVKRIMHEFTGKEIGCIIM